MMTELAGYLAGQKKNYILEGKQEGGYASGFRDYVGRKYQQDPNYFVKLVLDALMEAATKAWEKQPRQRGPDLFSISGYIVPEFLTRPTENYASAEDIENEDTAFEKVDHEFATVQDLLHDATIKMRKAAQSSSAAEREMRAVDVARRRAKGDMSQLLKKIADAEPEGDS